MEDLAKSWLSVQCQMIPGVERALVVLAVPGSDTMVPAAVWPESGAEISALTGAAELAASKRNAVAQGSRTGAGRLGYPLVANDRLIGAVAVEVSRASEAEQQVAMRLLQWGAAWFQVLVREKGLASRERLATVLELVGSAVEHANYDATATAIATELATRLACDRVSLGRRHGARIRIEAISHSARFDRRGAASRGVESAMEESLDQQSSVIFPTPERRIQCARAHESVSRDRHLDAILTVPITDAGRIVGAISLERSTGEPFTSHELDLCERTASLVGPILELKHRDDRPLPGRLMNALRPKNGASHGRWGLRLGVLAALVLAAAVTRIESDFRITARASLVGEIQRVVAAPEDGFIAEAFVRAGDLVAAGDPIATFDDRDLRLERSKWMSQREQLVKEQRGALASHDRTEIAVLGARIAQAEAQLGLIDSQLERTRVLAPLSGLVVSGDLSQSLGSPVEKGEVLFEIAPLDDYRILLRVDERDVSYVEPGQAGRLTLSALSDQPMAFSVEKVTPVSVAEDGANVFQVEAKLEQASERLRPGMDGVAKIDVQRRSLGWIWTRRVLEQARLLIWSWWP